MHSSNYKKCHTILANFKWNQIFSSRLNTKKKKHSFLRLAFEIDDYVLVIDGLCTSMWVLQTHYMRIDIYKKRFNRSIRIHSYLTIETVHRQSNDDYTNGNERKKKKKTNKQTNKPKLRESLAVKSLAANLWMEYTYTWQI